MTIAIKPTKPWQVPASSEESLFDYRIQAQKAISLAGDQRMSRPTIITFPGRLASTSLAEDQPILRPAIITFPGRLASTSLAGDQSHKSTHLQAMGHHISRRRVIAFLGLLASISLPGGLAVASGQQPTAIILGPRVVIVSGSRDIWLAAYVVHIPTPMPMANTPSAPALLPISASAVSPTCLLQSIPSGVTFGFFDLFR